MGGPDFVVLNLLGQGFANCKIYYGHLAVLQLSNRRANVLDGFLSGLFAEDPCQDLFLNFTSYIRPITTHNLQAHSGRFAAYKVPEAVEFIAALPKTPTGTVPFDLKINL